MKYSLSIAEVQTAFNYPWSIPMFENLAQNREAKVVFNWYFILLMTSFLGFTALLQVT
jgi:hypothetical protein